LKVLFSWETSVMIINLSVLSITVSRGFLIMSGYLTVRLCIIVRFNLWFVFQTRGSRCGVIYRVYPGRIRDWTSVHWSHLYLDNGDVTMKTGLLSSPKRKKRLLIYLGRWRIDWSPWRLRRLRQLITMTTLTGDIRWSTWELGGRIVTLATEKLMNSS